MPFFCKSEKSQARDSYKEKLEIYNVSNMSVEKKILYILSITGLTINVIFIIITIIYLYMNLIYISIITSSIFIFVIIILSLLLSLYLVFALLLLIG